GCAMTPSYATKNGNRRYRYYICTRAQKNGRHCCSSGAVPAAEIERFVIEQVRGIEERRRAGEGTQARANARPDDLAGGVRSSIERVDYDGAKGTVTLALRPDNAGPDRPAPNHINNNDGEAGPPRVGRIITRAFHFRRRGHGGAKELQPE